MSVVARRVRERTTLLREQRKKTNSSSLKKWTRILSFNFFCIPWNAILFKNIILKKSVLRIATYSKIHFFFKSGIDEVYSEREILLDEVIELAKDEKEKKREDKSKVMKEENMCKDLWKRVLENLTPSKRWYDLNEREMTLFQ